MARRKSRRQRLERTVAHIQHKWGQDAIHKGRPRGAIPHIPTGFPDLDAALGFGGIPRGRITTLSGTPTSGKVTLAALVLARAQVRGRPAAYIDLTHTCDADYLERCGVRLPELLVMRPRDGRQALEMTLALILDRSPLAAILFDHWGALAGEGGEQRYAAAVLDQLATRLARTSTALLVLDDPLPFWRRLWPGRKDGLGHYAALRLALSRERWLFSGPDVRGYRAYVTVQKNKFGPAGKTVPIEIHFNGTVRGDGI